MSENRFASYLDASKIEFRKRLKDRICVLLWLVPTLTFSLFAAILLRFDGTFSETQQKAFWAAIPLVLGVKISVFGVSKIGRIWHAFVSLQDVVRFLKASIAATAGIAAAELFLDTESTVSRGVILIDACITMLLVGGWLAIRRLHRERRDTQKRSHIQSDQQPVLIVGNARSCETLLHALKKHPSTKQCAVGLFTDQPRMLHREIAGVPVVGIVDADNIAVAAQQVGATGVLIVSGEFPGHQVRQLAQDCEKANIDAQVIPDVNRIVDGHVNFQPREIAIEDLLGRKSVTLDQDKLRDWVRNRTVLVTGSSGSIGSEISKQLLRFKPGKLILLDRSETGQFFLQRKLLKICDNNQIEIVIADTTDLASMRRIFIQHRPQIIFHAAAYKHVPLMEQHPGEAIKNIIGATRNLADLASQFATESFVMISTDKAVNPTSVMGCCKRVAELYIQSLASSQGPKLKSHNKDCRFVTVRFGNVLGSAGSVIPIFRKQISEGGPLTITHPEMKRFFMTIPEASQLVIQAGKQGHGGEIFVLDMGQPINITDLAADMVRLSGLELGKDIDLEFTGLRPGEKLYEELYSPQETQQPTQHPQILVAESVSVSQQAIKRSIQQLMQISEADGATIRRALAHIVPDYRAKSTLSPETDYSFSRKAA